MRSEAEEVRYHLAAAPIEDKQVRETPELRAVRESLELALVNNAFLPPEEPWLNGRRAAVVKAIRRVWLDTKDNARAEASANWLLSILPNPMEWCQQPENETVWAAARQQTAGQIGLRRFPVEGTPE